MNSINHKKGLKILRKILLKMRKERTEKELGRFLIQSSLSSSDDFGVQKSNVNTYDFEPGLNDCYHLPLLRWELIPDCLIYCLNDHVHRFPFNSSSESFVVKICFLL